MRPGPEARPLAIRIAERVTVEDDCWIVGGTLSHDGYAYISIGHAGRVYVHVAVYEMIFGPVPAGLEVDHTCRRRNCANPRHLEAVTHAENMRRAVAARTHCRRGHERNHINGYDQGGKWRCRVCRRDAERAAA